MDVLIRILTGLFVVALGVLMTWKTQWFLSILGQVASAERWFGGGGTRFFYKLCGIGLAIFGLIIATNLFSVLFGGMILSLFGIK